ncbi:hypothetical protein QBC34DRAFT_92764 [Podospora aff. communis PSN243]|uniref:Uncharacterized protein n=1 Tax=Podospora aff. communis PSN243 TaxID=3040156 RepID=A0AAV9GMV1_9PEZI|nr:hypothetical protein QBC34DRAFT_92764 [Podospora aff. communis PSN243]
MRLKKVPPFSTVNTTTTPSRRSRSSPPIGPSHVHAYHGHPPMRNRPPGSSSPDPAGTYLQACTEWCGQVLPLLAVYRGVSRVLCRCLLFAMVAPASFPFSHADMTGNGGDEKGKKKDDKGKGKDVRSKGNDGNRKKKDQDRRNPKPRKGSQGGNIVEYTWPDPFYPKAKTDGQSHEDTATQPGSHHAPISSYDPSPDYQHSGAHYGTQYGETQYGETQDDETQDDSQQDCDSDDQPQDHESADSQTQYEQQYSGVSHLHHTDTRDSTTSSHHDQYYAADNEGATKGMLGGVPYLPDPFSSIHQPITSNTPYYGSNDPPTWQAPEDSFSPTPQNDTSRTAQFNTSTVDHTTDYSENTHIGGGVDWRNNPRGIVDPSTGYDTGEIEAGLRTVNLDDQRSAQDQFAGQQLYQQDAEAYRAADTPYNYREAGEVEDLDVSEDYTVFLFFCDRRQRPVEVDCLMDDHAKHPVISDKLATTLGLAVSKTSKKELEIAPGTVEIGGKLEKLEWTEPKPDDPNMQPRRGNTTFYISDNLELEYDAYLPPDFFGKVESSHRRRRYEHRRDDKYSDRRDRRDRHDKDKDKGKGKDKDSRRRR